MISLIDYGMGNLFSVRKALEHAGAEINIVSSPDAIKKSSAIVLPGVGNFGDGATQLLRLKLTDPLRDEIKSGKPFLGICLGMQLLMEESEESPGIKGLGIFKGRVIKFRKSSLKVPHMGWNNISIKRKNPFLSGIANNAFFYFVHSFYVSPEDETITAAETNYGIDFSSAIGRDKIFATQFHPEKSQNAGLKILSNFVSIVKNQ